MTLNEQQRQAINRINSFCMLLIVIMHCVIGNSRDTLWEGEYISLLFFRTFTRVAVPIFFILSGYLLFNNYSVKKIKKRTFTVFIPYILWSLLSVFIFIFFKQLSVTSHFINTDIQFTLTSILKNIFISPINGSLWFLRDLYLLILLSPIIFKIRKIILPIFFILLIVWLFDFKYTFLIESSLFFLLGVLLANKNLRNINTVYNHKFYRRMVLMLYMLICALFPLLVIYMHADPMLITKLSVVFGLITFSLNIDLFFIKNRFNMLLDKFKRYSFFVYASHLLVAQFIKKIIIAIIPTNNSYYILIDYILTIIITICLCCIVQHIIFKLSPKLLGLFTGNRY